MRSMLFNLRFLLPVLFASVAIGQEMPPAQVEVVTLQEVSLAPTIQLKADVVALQDAVLSSEVEGSLQSVLLVGSRIEKGQVIAQIEPEKLAWQVQREESKLAGLLADLRFRQSEVERFRLLASRDNASKTQLQRELASKEITEQQILSAQADLAQAKRDLEKASILAPFDGILAERFASQGEFIRVGDPLVRLVNEQHKDISVPAPIRFRHLYQAGKLVDVDYHGEQKQFPIRQVVPIGDPSSRMMEVRLNVNDSHLIVGDAVTVHLPKAESAIEVPVPRDALVIRGSQRFIYLVDANSQAQQVAAKIKYAEGAYVVLASGVKAGDKVIVRGAERLQPSSKVAITSK